MPIKIEAHSMSEPPRKSKVYDVISQAVQEIKKDIPQLAIPGTKVIFPKETSTPSAEHSPQEQDHSEKPQ